MVPKQHKESQASDQKNKMEQKKMKKSKDKLKCHGSL